jgi:hypothetical protein
MSATAPYVRDSATSKAAADRVGVSMSATQRQSILRALFAAGIHGCTRQELEVQCSMSGDSVRPRVAELMSANPPLVENSDEIRRTETGRAAHVLVLSLAGRLALSEVS